MVTVDNRISSSALVKGLQHVSAYPDATGPVVLHETHVSWVFLVGDVAYKVKKPIVTDFLDYGTLEKRRLLCHEEMRLDQRYAKELYLGVVPITLIDGKPCVEGEGVPVEYAVKMRRFPEDALLSERLKAGALPRKEVTQLAATIANFHQRAAPLDPDSGGGCSGAPGSPEAALRSALANLEDLESGPEPHAVAALHTLRSWTSKYFEHHRRLFNQRVAAGFVRECHGDLHLQNIVRWQGQWMPFDGIEFNERFRWIDVLSDAAFPAMDFAARGHLELCRSFINDYLEHSDDYHALTLLRWYLVYRALVRAKVARIRAHQDGMSQHDRAEALRDCTAHIDLAYRFSLPEAPRLWITHGLSGSGKTTASETLIQRHGVIRVRSDIQRKRRFGLAATERPSAEMESRLYSPSASEATYTRLRRLARAILRSGYSVVVDAAFLRGSERAQFQRLAYREGVGFAILDCQADPATLRRRVAERTQRDDDASDADLRVLQSQLATQEPLTVAERHSAVSPQTLSGSGTLG